MSTVNAAVEYNLVPLPRTRRGYGTFISAHPSSEHYIYCSGKTVVIRSLTNDKDNKAFTQHKCDVNVARWSSNGVYVCSGDSQGTILIWHSTTLQLKYTYNINKCVNDISWDMDSTRICIVGDGATSKVKVITIDSGNTLGDIGHIHTLQVLSCSIRPVKPIKLVTCSEDMTVVQYDGIPFKYNGVQYKGHTRYPNQVKYNHDGTQYISVGADSRMVVYDGSTGNVMKEFGGDLKDTAQHSGSIVGADWCSDNKHIVTCSLDKTCRIWDTETGTSTHTFTFGKTVLDQQVGVCWHHYKNTIISISLSGAINYLSTDSTQAQRVLHGHQNTIQCMALSRDNSQLYTAGLDGELCLWDLNSGSAQWLTHINHDNKIVAAIAVDTKFIYTAALNQKLRITDINSKQSDEIAINGQPVALTVSNDSIVFVACAQKFIAVIHGNKLVQTINVEYAPTCMQLTVDSKTLFIGDKERKPALHSYTVSSSNLTAANNYNEYDKPINDIAVSRDAKYVVTVDTEASVYIRDSSSLEILNKTGWRFHQGSVTAADFSADGVLATGSVDFSVILWSDVSSDVNGANRTRLDAAHQFGVQFVKWTNKNQFLSIGADKVIKLWHIT